MNETASFLPAPPAHPVPMSVGQILERTYRVTRDHFWRLVGIAAIPSCLMMIMVAAIEAVAFAPMLAQFPQPADPQSMLRIFSPGVFIPVFVVMTVVSCALISFYLAAASFASVQADLGVKVSFREAYGFAWQHPRRYLWLIVLLYLYAALPIFIVELLALFVSGMFGHGAAEASPALYFLIPLGVLLYIAAAVYSVIMGLRISLAFPACVAEGLAARSAVKRSFALTRAAKGRIFLVILVVFVAVYGAMFVVEIVAMIFAFVGVFIAMALHIPWSPPWSYLGIGLLGICAFVALVLFTSVTYAVITTALAILYRDQRLRIDGPPATPLPATPPAGELA